MHGELVRGAAHACHVTAAVDPCTQVPETCLKSLKSWWVQRGVCFTSVSPLAVPTRRVDATPTTMPNCRFKRVRGVVWSRRRRHSSIIRCASGCIAKRTLKQQTHGRCAEHTLGSNIRLVHIQTLPSAFRGAVLGATLHEAKPVHWHVNVYRRQSLYRHVSGMCRRWIDFPEMRDGSMKLQTFSWQDCKDERGRRQVEQQQRWTHRLCAVRLCVFKKSNGLLVAWS